MIKTLALAALLVAGPMLAQAQVSPDRHLTRIAVFREPYFPYYMSDPKLAPVRVQGWLQDCGLEADVLSAADLADPARFNTGRYGMLAYVYGNVYPQAALANIRAFHHDGGCLLLIGGTPFCHPCVPGGARGWLFGPADRPQPVRDDQVAHSGKASVRMDGHKGGWFGPGTAPMPAKPGEVFSAGAWMKTSADLKPDERSRLYVRSYDDRGGFHGQGGPLLPPPGSDWTWVEGVFTALPETTVVDLSMQMWCERGTVWLDDAVLTRGPKCDPAANLLTNPGFEQLPDEPSWTDLGHHDDFGHDKAGTGGFRWVTKPDTQECLDAGKLIGLDCIPWADRVMPGDYCLLDRSTLPAEDHAQGLVAALRDGKVTGWPVALVEHRCPEFRGAVDLCCGANMVGALRREEQRHLVVRCATEVLRRAARMTPEQQKTVLAQLDAASPAAELKRVPEPVHEAKPFPGLFPRTPPPAHELTVLNLAGKPREEQFLATVLQGLVNRRQPRIYTHTDAFSGNSEVTEFWLANLKRRGYTTTAAAEVPALVKQYRDCWQGAVLYPASFWTDRDKLPLINVITLLCAVRDLLPVTKEQNLALKLPVAFDASAAWGSVRDAHLWALRELWPQANHHVFAFHHPNDLPLCDYLVAFRIFPIAVYTTMPDATDDLFERLLRETPPNIPVMGCWGRYGEQPPLAYLENELVSLTSQWGKVFVVSEWAANLSVHSGVPVKPEELRQRPHPKIAFDRSKVYVCLDMSDGDNLQYIYNPFYTDRWWGNRDRGKVNLGWSVGPGSVDLMPDVLAYYYGTATPADEFLCAVSGAGYCYLDRYASQFGPRSTEVLDSFLDLTARMMARSDTQIINPFSGSREIYERYAQRVPNLAGLLADYGKGAQLKYDEANYTVGSGRVPVFRNLVCWGGQGDLVADTIKEVREATPADRRPAFLHVFAINWWNRPEDLVKVMAGLGDGYVACTPNQFVDLWRQSQAR